jgi:hypothetical protein
MIPYYKNYGDWNGMNFRELKRRREKIIYVPELGSKVLEDLRRCWVPSYRNFEDFVKKMNILPC